MTDSTGETLPFPEPREAVTGQEFRNAIARVPSGVHIVTTAGAAGQAGFTATAVASVSDDPPTILVCLNRKSPQNRLIQVNACFAVNLVPKHQVELANIFAGRTGLHLGARFSHGSWTQHVTGAPVLEDAVATLDCELSGFQAVGSHTVFFGRVVGTRVKPVAPDGSSEILVYHDRHYSEI